MGVFTPSVPPDISDTSSVLPIPWTPQIPQEYHTSGHSWYFRLPRHKFKINSEIEWEILSNEVLKRLKFINLLMVIVKLISCIQTYTTHELRNYCTFINKFPIILSTSIYVVYHFARVKWYATYINLSTATTTKKYLFNALTKFNIGPEFPLPHSHSNKRDNVNGSIRSPTELGYSDTTA